MLKRFVLFHDFEGKDRLVAVETWYKCWVPVMQLNTWE